MAKKAKQNLKILVVATAGNILEYYDWALYGFFAPMIASIFFPFQNSRLSLIVSLSVYAIGFLFRPLGGFLFGYIGDKFGRKKALMSSISLMAASTCLMALIPSYDQIGWFASFLMIFARATQGLSVGGEYSGAVVYVTENSPPNLRGLYSGFVGSSTLLGCLLGTLVACLFSLSIFPLWAWRIPFLIGMLGGIVALYFRKYLTETYEYNGLTQLSQHNYRPIKAIMRNSRSLCLAVSAFGVAGVISGYSMAYLNSLFTTSLGYSLTTSLLLVAFGLIFYIITCPIIGHMSQKINPLIVLIYSAIAYIIIIIPCIKLLSKTTLIYVLLGQFILSAVSGIFWGACNLFVYQLFPISCRYSGVAISDSLARAFLSGPTPVICSLLVFNLDSIFAAAIFLIGCCLVFLGIGAYDVYTKNKIMKFNSFLKSQSTKQLQELYESSVSE